MRTKATRPNSNASTEEDKETTAARKKLERELAEAKRRIRNKRMRLNLVRNDKELQALTHEVESLKENNQRLEGELLTSMEGADARPRESRNSPKRSQGAHRSRRPRRKSRRRSRS